MTAESIASVAWYCTFFYHFRVPGKHDRHSNQRPAYVFLLDHWLSVQSCFVQKAAGDPWSRSVWMRLRSAGTDSALPVPALRFAVIQAGRRQ